MLVTPMLGILVVYLAGSALAIPRAVWRFGRSPAPGTRAGAGLGRLTAR
jgi:hypothetical protein